MAAVSEAASGSSRVSSVVFESTLDRRLQGLTNTMESIQGLSTWCIENKKYHSIIVRSWLKWLKKHASQRLNLFYLANDVIQNCKRKNAVVYRTTFTDVLPEAIKLINTLKDSKVRKCVDRILCIWEERNVYSEEFISRLRSGLTQQDEPPAPANPKAALRSKIVAEFVPSSIIEHLTKYRSSIDEIDLREKQLAAMRVDVCSTVALKKLKDKAGGKRFSKDFEDGSAKLQDFVTFLNGEVQKGPAFIEALENADIFYEMQYKEVKIVTNAYQTFANRVLHLKRKLDALKASLPDPDDSPIPSPSEDAPSPTGSESPFHSLPQNNSPDPELEGQVMEEDLIALVDAPSPLSSPGDRDNRDVEDMELSDVEDTVGPSIIVEERSEQPDPASLSTETPVMEASQSIHAAPEKENTSSAATGISTTSSLPINLAGVDLGKISSIISTLTNVMKSTAGVSPASHSSATTQSTTQVSAASPSLKSPTVSSSQSVPTSSSLASVLSQVDINPSTLLSVLSKTQTQGGGFQAAGVSPASHSSATTQSTTQVSAASPSLKSPTVSSSQSVPTSSSLASVLSQVDINPSTLLSVLSKTQTQGGGFQGLSSCLNGQTGTTSTHSGSDVNPFPDPTLTAYTHPSPKTTLVPFAFPPVQAGDSTPQGNVTLQSSQSFGIVPTMEQEGVEKEKEHLTSLSSTLDSKIDSFLQGNPGLKGFHLDFPSVFSWSKAVSSPSASTENQGGTPVRDESGATPTQDEVMDDPVVQPFMPQKGPLQTSKTSALAAGTASPVLPNYTNTSWYEQNRLGLQYGSGSQSGGQNYEKDLTVKPDLQSSVPPLADMGHLQHVDSLLPSLASNKQLSTKITDTINQIAQATPFSASKGMEPVTAANDDWYSNTYGNGQEQHVSARSDSYGENQHCSQDPRRVLNPHRFFNTPLPPPPPIPQLPPPPPQDLFPPVAGGVKNPVELSDTVDKVQAGDIPAYVPGNVANFDYDERLSNQAKEPFHSHLNASGSQHCGITQRPALLVPQNGPMNYIIRPRVPVNQYRNPSMPPPGRPVPFLAGRGFGEPRRCRPFHEPPNRPQAPHREPYLGQLCDAPHCSPTSSPQPPHDIEPSHSPQSHTFYAEKRPLLPRHPEHGLPSHLEHRPPSPQHYHAPRPGHFPPQRPLRHPPTPHPREPPFQRGKRPGPPFGGSPRPAGQFYPTKRPFLPPRY